MRKLVWSLGLLLPLAALFSVAWLARPVSRPNVLLITVDTLRADRLGCYGNEHDTSPAIDALAARGVVFENAFTSSALSGPSHASILTSLPVPTHEVINNTVLLPDRFSTLPEILREAGYETACFVSHEFVSAKYGLAQGCEIAETHHVPSHLPGHVGHEDLDEDAAPLDAVFEAARAWLAIERERPFFLWLHAQHPHVSYEPPPPYDTMFGEAPETEHDLRCRDTLQRHQNILISLTEAERERVVALYDGEVAFVDAQLGGILHELRASGRLEETLVVVTADHGEMLFDDVARRRTGHGREQRDPVLRIPLVVAGPGVPSQVRRDQTVGSIDLAPTILELAAIRPPSSFRGRSLVPVIEEAASVRETVAAAALHSDGLWRLTLRKPERVLACQVVESSGASRCWTHDLTTDPAEARAVPVGARTEEPAEAAAMLKEIVDWFGSARENARSPELTTDEAVLEMLRRGGYLDEETP